MSGSFHPFLNPPPVSMSDSRQRALSGRRILVTRPRDQAGEFLERLSSMGAEVLLAPTIQIVEPRDPEPLNRAVRKVGTFDWVIFTSVNGVARFVDALEEQSGTPAEALKGVRLCAIGAGSRRALEVRGLRADLVPPEYVAESLVEAFRDMGSLTGKRILIPRAEAARDLLPVELSGLGADVVAVPAYRTIRDEESRGKFAQEIAGGSVDLVTFTSGSAVRAFSELIGPSVGRSLIATIGPVTSSAVREMGWEVDIEASVHTVAGLCEAIRRFYAIGDPGSPSSKLEP